MANALTAALPKFSPLSANPHRDEARGPQDSGVVRLPAFFVHDNRLRPFTERELYTPAGLKQLAVKRYITEFDSVLNGFSLPLLSGASTAEDRGNSPEKRAMRAFDEAEAKERSARISDLEGLERIH